jgi:hypothetical protein
MTNKKNNQGFKEDIDSLTGKRTLHCIAAEKGKFKKENVSKKSAVVPVLEAEDVITLRFDNSEEFAELAEEFEEDNDIELVIRKKDEDIFVDIPVEHSADFIDFLADNDIKIKEDLKAEKKENESVYVKTNEKVANTGKKDRANSSVKLKTEVDKIIAEAQISWLKNPGEEMVKAE